MKKVNISSIMYYGRIYGNDEQNYYFSVLDYKVYDKSELICNFGFTNNMLSDSESLRNEYNYIALFQVDIIKLMVKFLLSINNRYIFNEIKGLEPEMIYIFFQKYIEINTYSHHRWIEYENISLTKAAIKWCEDNGIPYVI